MGMGYTSRMFTRMARFGVITLLLIAATPPAASAGSENWIELRSPNFIVYSNANEKQVRHVAYQFEMIRAVFRELFNIPGSAQDQPVIIIAAKDESTLKTLLPEFWAKKGSRHPAGIYIGGPEKNYVGLMLDVTMNQEAYEPFEAVYHEYVHYLTRRMVAQLPLWMVEGLAEFYGNTRIENKKVLVGTPSATNLMVLRQGQLLPLDTLFGVNASSPHYNEANKVSIFYAESWALTHYLITRDWREHTQHLNDFVALLGKEVAPDEAARRTIGAPDALQEALSQYIGHFSFMVARMAAPATIDEKSFQLQAISDAESLTARADFMAHDRHYAEARGMLEEALKLNPNLASAHESMGFLCAEQNKLDEANKWYSQAVALNSQSFMAHYYYAANMLKGKMDADSASKAEVSLRAAIDINPGFAPAYDALAWLVATRGGNAEDPKRLNEAYLTVLTAVSLEPGNFHYRLDSAHVLERMGRVDDAIRVAGLAASMAKTTEEQSEALAFLSQAHQYRDYQKQMQERQEAAEKRRVEMAARGANPPPPDTVALPEHPPRPPLLPDRRVAEGTIADGRCSRATLEITFHSATRDMQLYTDNFMKIPYSSLNFTPEGTFNPCVELKGWHARITYHPATDQPDQGEIVAVELVKK